jgi:hypothetical protein
VPAYKRTLIFGIPVHCFSVEAGYFENKKNMKETSISSYGEENLMGTANLNLNIY